MCSQLLNNKLISAIINIKANKVHKKQRKQLRNMCTSLKYTFQVVLGFGSLGVRCSTSGPKVLCSRLSESMVGFSTFYSFLSHKEKVNARNIRPPSWLGTHLKLQVPSLRYHYFPTQFYPSQKCIPLSLLRQAEAKKFRQTIPGDIRHTA